VEPEEAKLMGEEEQLLDLGVTSSTVSIQLMTHGSMLLGLVQVYFSLLSISSSLFSLDLHYMR
jgi:hypothetical protein